MMVMFEGEGCTNCPFFRHRHLPQVCVDSKPMIPEFTCTLDGLVELADLKIEIKLGNDGKRAGDCPFGPRGPGQIEVGADE